MNSLKWGEGGGGGRCVCARACMRVCVRVFVSECILTTDNTDDIINY